MKTLEQLEEELNLFLSSFKNWEDAIIAYLKLKPSFVENVDDTLAIQGWNIEKFVNHVSDWVKDHMSKINPHETSVVDLGGYTKQEILNLLTLYQKQDVVPLTKFHNVSATIDVNKKLTITIGRMFFMGRDYGKHVLSLNLGTADRQIIHVQRNGSGKDAKFSLITSTTRLANNSTLRIGEVTGANSTPKFTPFTLAHICNVQLSMTPIGHGIPVSNGLPSEEGVVDKKWFKDWK